MMTRINDFQMIQLVEDPNREYDQLVFLNESSGEEVAIFRGDWPAMQDAISYFTGPPVEVPYGRHYKHEPTVDKFAALRAEGLIPPQGTDPFADSF